MSIDNIPLAGGWIDRDAATRSSADSLELAWNDPNARVLRMRGMTIPVVTTEEDTALALCPTSDVSAAPDERMYLGRYQEHPVFAVSQQVDADAVAEASDAVRWHHPFETVISLSPEERELVAMTSALLRWHEAAAFSPRDGANTEVADGGWSRRDAHGSEFFPRTDPAVIVLIEHEDKVLLGSNALWESGRFSLLAGFVEAGESLEGAVAREVFEESGVRVANIRYLGSQPWPFPRSLMVGFHATLAEGQDPEDLQPDPSEISELRWFTREEVLSPPEGILLPGDLSIAGALVTAWAEGRTPAPPVSAE